MLKIFYRFSVQNISLKPCNRHINNFKLILNEIHFIDMVPITTIPITIIPIDTYKKSGR